MTSKSRSLKFIFKGGGGREDLSLSVSVIALSLSLSFFFVCLVGSGPYTHVVTIYSIQGLGYVFFKKGRINDYWRL